jgi:hypothetical protein
MNAAPRGAGFSPLRRPVNSAAADLFMRVHIDECPLRYAERLTALPAALSTREPSLEFKLQLGADD